VMCANHQPGAFCCQHDSNRSFVLEVEGFDWSDLEGHSARSSDGDRRAGRRSPPFALKAGRNQRKVGGRRVQPLGDDIRVTAASGYMDEEHYHPWRLAVRVVDGGRNERDSIGRFCAQLALPGTLTCPCQSYGIGFRKYCFGGNRGQERRA